jgi:hypothetical protein
MKTILTILFIIAVCSVSAFSQSVQNEPQRFSYYIWGSVVDEQSQPTAKISVCFIPAERPLGGRIPCTKTDEAGNFAFTVKDTPDKYVIFATTKESPLFLEGDEEKGHRFKSSEVMEFGAKDESRKVTIQFDAKQ